MTPEDITRTLRKSFGPDIPDPVGGAWQIETPGSRILVLLSDDQSWLRLLVPIAPAQAAHPFLEQLLEANFDATQETRYALHQEVLWGVFQHPLESLSITDFSAALQRLVNLYKLGLSDHFNQLVESRIRQIIEAAKRQGQSLDATLQTLDRFYEEGLLGSIDDSQVSRQESLAAWQRQLERLWSEVEPS